MSWIEKLYRTYEVNKGCIGNPNDKVPLLPICHTTQKAHIQVVLDDNGNFLRATIIPKAEATTIVPATEESAGRSGKKPGNHPLFDKLQYLAGDFFAFGGEVTSGFSSTPKEPHQMYMRDLEKWCSSAFKHPKVEKILTYLKKGSLVKDLVETGILPSNSLKTQFYKNDKWDGNPREMPEFFRVHKNLSPEDSFIRFAVEIPGDPQVNLSEDPTLWDSWADYYSNRQDKKGLCSVIGEEKTLAIQHPAKIRNAGDKAKLISSNDTSGFTFRGRFTTSDEACGVSFEVTQKAHSALRWLIGRQGSVDGDQAVVAWALSGAKIMKPTDDSFDLFGEVTLLKGGYTAQDVGLAIKQKVRGYSSKIASTDEIIILVIDSATPGRMAIKYFRELKNSNFLERLEGWHTQCCWFLKRGDENRKPVTFWGAPSPKQIAETAYGQLSERGNKKLLAATIVRILPCIIDGTPFPVDLVESCIRRTCARNSFKAEKWEKPRQCLEWEKTLAIACALYRFQNKERSYSMTHEPSRKTRDYLYGSLLAVAEDIEGRALYLADEKRETNAAKLMQRFAERPYSTWRTIELSLAPYQIQLKSKHRHSFLHFRKRELDALMSAFSPEDFISDRALTGEFLLGYHCERAKLNATPEKESGEDEKNEGEI